MTPIPPLREGPTRLEANTLKLRMPFGTLYIHVGHVEGRISEINYSLPGKHVEPQIDAILGAIFEGITQEVTDIRERWDV